MASTVMVCILTFRRPQDLVEILPLIGTQVRGAGRDVSVMVVDNDPAASAFQTCQQAGIRYVHEPRPGISAARNRALLEAEKYDLLVFIDDDERPGVGWLAALLDTFDEVVSRGETCCGVVGPVVSTFDTPLEPWIEAGGFFDRRRLPTGSRVDAAATNNLLLDLRIVRAAGLSFDERFGLTGGSDNLFTRALTAKGGRLVWCDEAVVTDVVPPDRSTREWVVRRRLRIGNSWSRATLVLATSTRERLMARVSLLGHGSVRIAGGLALLLLGTLTRDVRHRARGVRTAVHGLGIASGAVGWTYAEYRRTTG